MWVFKRHETPEIRFAFVGFWFAATSVFFCFFLRIFFGLVVVSRGFLGCPEAPALEMNVQRSCGHKRTLRS